MSLLLGLTAVNGFLTGVTPQCAPYRYAARCGQTVCSVARREVLGSLFAAALFSPTAASAMVDSSNPANNYYVRASSPTRAPVSAASP